MDFITIFLKTHSHCPNPMAPIYWAYSSSSYLYAGSSSRFKFSVAKSRSSFSTPVAIKSLSPSTWIMMSRCCWSSYTGLFFNSFIWSTDNFYKFLWIVISSFFDWRESEALFTLFAGSLKSSKWILPSILSYLSF